MVTQDLNSIHSIIIHTTATPFGAWIDRGDIDVMHKARKFSMIGYHRLYRLDASVEQGRPYTRRGAHVKGNNINTLGLALVGGLDENGKPANTYSDHMMHALLADIINIRTFCPNIRSILGHRDYSPDLNGDGLITPNEFMKECPCFNVTQWLDDMDYVV